MMQIMPIDLNDKNLFKAKCHDDISCKEILLTMGIDERIEKPSITITPIINYLLLVITVYTVIMFLFKR